MLKKWAFILAFTTIAIFASLFSSDSASATTREEIFAQNPNKAYIEFTTNGENTYIIFTNARLWLVPYISGTHLLSIDGSWKWYYKYSSSVQFSDGSNAGATDSTIGTFHLSDFKVKTGNINIYNSATGNDAFFTVPNPYVMKGITAVEELPQTMVATLVDGGLVSTGLKVLAVLLGVSLIARLVYLFVRSKS